MLRSESTEQRKYSVIIFDVGGVLFHFNEEFYEGGFFEEKYGIPRNKTVAFFKSEHHSKHEKGIISTGEYFRELKLALNYPGNFEQFREDFIEGNGPHKAEDVWEFFYKLKVKYYGEASFWILSNLNELLRQHLMEEWPGAFENFMKLFWSCEMGCMKPEPEIYIKMLAADKIPPCNCIFIDDREENGECPKKIGMRFIHFRGLDKLREELKTIYGFYVEDDEDTNTNKPRS